MPTGNNNGATPIEPGDWQLTLLPSVRRCLCCQDLILGGLYAYRTMRKEANNHLCFDCWNQYDLMWPVPIWGLPRYREPVAPPRDIEAGGPRPAEGAALNV